MKQTALLRLSCWALLLLAGGAFATNPVITTIRTADPSCHIWADGKVWLYASHDMDNATDYDSMDGYHVFSSSNLVDWTDYGQVLHSSNVTWGMSGFMWAPDCAYKNGIYYFYYPHRETNDIGNWRIGVATSSLPQGPFVDIGHYIAGTDNTDPCCFIDDDGQAYLYWSPNPYAGIPPRVAKLSTNMIDLAETPHYIDYGASNCKEGTYMHKYNGKYYFSYTDWSDPVDQGYYAMGDSPYGPFTYKGALNAAVPGAQDHHSMLEYHGQWYYFYHIGTYNGTNQYRRNTAIEYMYYNPDGTIQKIVQTTTGVAAVNPPAPAPDDWAAWNDCAWAAGDATGAFSTNSPYRSTAQYLMASNAVVLPQQVTFTTNAAVGLNFLSGTFAIPPGTDAAQWFAGKIGTNNAINWGQGSIAMTFSGLNTGKLYNLVLWSSRGGDSAAYSNRITEITLSSVSAFANLSSAGADKSTSSMTNDRTRVRAAVSPGLVTRYDAVNPGTDGTIVVTMTASSDQLWPGASATNGYLNAFALMTSTNQSATNAAPPPDPTPSNSPGWTAYNDTAWQSDDASGTASSFTTYSPSVTPSGTLISDAGATLPVSVSITTNAGQGAINFFALSTNVTAWPSGTDAANEFEGKVGRGYTCELQGTGVIVNVSLSGLNSAKRYKLVVWSSRLADGSNYSNRLTDVTLSGVSSFTNTSTETDGVTRFATTLAQDSTTVRSTFKPGYGPVARFENIDPGGDGAIVFSVRRNAASAGNGYLNAFKLVEAASSAGDVDSDGMDDSWETTNFGGTNSVNGGALQDWDGDGFPNYYEYRAGTSPTNASSALTMGGPALAVGQGIVIQWDSVAGHTYAILNKGNITSAWTVLQSAIPATPPINTATTAAATAQGFWKIKVE